MEILQLKYFKDAAETENFSKTAQKYGVPTSAVSQSIRRLENEMGTDLFERSSNRISLNEDGKTLYRAVCQMGKQLEDTRRLFADHSGELSGEIRLQIGCNRRVVSDVIRQFSQMHPQVTFVLKHGTGVDSEGFDLVISDDERLKERYEKTELIREQIAVAFPKNHPLVGKSTLRIKDLAQEPFVTMQPGERLHHLTQSLCMQAGFFPKIAIQCDDPYYIRKYIEMGLGIGFVPMFSWRGQLEELVCKPLKGVERTTYAFWDPGRYMTRATKAFLELLRQVCHENR